MKPVFIIVIFCLLVSFVLAVTISDVNNQIVRFDQNMSETFRVHTSSTERTIFEQITRLGGTALWFVSGAGAAFLLAQRRYADLVTGVVVIGGGKLLNLWLKGGFDRPRPEWGEWLRGGLELFSFPSGHAMMSLLVYGYLAVVLWRMMPTRSVQIALAAGTVVLVGLIGLSRVALGRHYPSDVLAGYSMGGAWLSLCLAGRMWIEDYRRVRARHPYPVTKQEEETVYETNRGIDQRR